MLAAVIPAGAVPVFESDRLLDLTFSPPSHGGCYAWFSVSMFAGDADQLPPMAPGSVLTAASAVGAWPHSYRKPVRQVTWASCRHWGPGWGWRQQLQRGVHGS